MLSRKAAARDGGDKLAGASGGGGGTTSSAAPSGREGRRRYASLIILAPLMIGVVACIMLGTEAHFQAERSHHMSTSMRRSHGQLAHDRADAGAGTAEAHGVGPEIALPVGKATPEDVPVHKPKKKAKRPKEIHEHQQTEEASASSPQPVEVPKRREPPQHLHEELPAFRCESDSDCGRHGACIAGGECMWYVISPVRIRPRTSNPAIPLSSHAFLLTDTPSIAPSLSPFHQRSLPPIPSQSLPCTPFPCISVPSSSCLFLPNAARCYMRVRGAIVPRCLTRRPSLVTSSTRALPLAASLF